MAYFGYYNYTLDAANRIIVPSRFREQLGAEAVRTLVEREPDAPQTEKRIFLVGAVDPAERAFGPDVIGDSPAFAVFGKVPENAVEPFAHLL